METSVFPFIGDRPVAVVEAREIPELLTPIWFTKLETARRVRHSNGGRACRCVVTAKGEKAVPGPLNAAKASSGQTVIKQGTAAKLTDPASPKGFGNLPPRASQSYSTHQVTTPTGFGPQSGNYPPGAAGQRYTTRQGATPKGFGPQSGNYPPGAVGQTNTRQATVPKGFGPPPPRQAVGQGRISAAAARSPIIGEVQAPQCQLEWGLTSSR
jgi:hypothetical protein